MKILFVCGGGYVYGKEIVTFSLMQGLRERGHQVMCLTSTWNDGDFVQRLDELCIPYRKLPLGFISRTLSWPAILMTLDQARKLPALWLGYKRCVREFKPDVILHSNFHHLFLLWPLLRGQNNLFHVHDGFAPTIFYRSLLKFLSLRIRRFVGVSRFVAESLGQVGVSRSKVSYVVNGISANDSNIDEDVQARFSGIGSNHTKASANLVSVGIVGQVGEWKGHDDLIGALEILKRGGECFVCQIYGNGDPDYTEKLKKKIYGYSLNDDVQWVGFVNDKRLIYKEIDICVVPSRFSEPLGLVAAEASLFGIPIVATRCGGLSEVVQDKKTGYLVDPGHPEQLADKLRLLIRSKELRNKMGLAARQYALQELTSTRMVDQMERLLYSTLTH